LEAPYKIPALNYKWGTVKIIPGDVTYPEGYRTNDQEYLNTLFVNFGTANVTRKDLEEWIAFIHEDERPVIYLNETSYKGVNSAYLHWPNDSLGGINFLGILRAYTFPDGRYIKSNLSKVLPPQVLRAKKAHENPRRTFSRSSGRVPNSPQSERERTDSARSNSARGYRERPPANRERNNGKRSPPPSSNNQFHSLMSSVSM